MPGLVSRGPGCARAHHPGIYTRVLDFDNHQNIPEKNQGEVSSSLDLFNCIAACEVQGGAKRPGTLTRQGRRSAREARKKHILGRKIYFGANSALASCGP